MRQKNVNHENFPYFVVHDVHSIMSSCRLAIDLVLKLEDCFFSVSRDEYGELLIFIHCFDIAN